MTADKVEGSQPAVRLGIYGLSYEFGGRKILDEVSFELKTGEILSLLGPNGAGKSTLLKTIAGILPATGARSTRAQIRYLGHDIQDQSLAWRSQRIAYVGADLTAQFSISAEQAVMLGRSSQGGKFWSFASGADRKQVEQAMKRCFCWELRNRDLHTLSGGERQLVAFARAWVQGARVLFLDESLSRMDLHHQAAIGRLMTELAAEGYSFVLVSHDINIASEWAHSVLLLKGGVRVAHGPIREVLTEERVKTLYPDSELFVGSNPITGAPKVFFGRVGK